MHLTRLALTDFRSYPELSLELGTGVTMFSGPNGEGKTNLVEAIGYLATLGSHRVATDAPLVRRGAERAVLRAAVTGAQGSTLVEIELNPGRANRVRLNRAPMPRPRDVLGALRTVLFAPEDLALVKGDPGERRRFLDELLTATAPRYAGVRSDYERILRPELIDAYEEQGYCWVVTGSTQRGRAESEPEVVPEAIKYYAELQRRGELAYQASPFAEGAKAVPFNFDYSFDYYPLDYRRPGPLIQVYRLRGGKCA